MVALSKRRKAASVLQTRWRAFRLLILAAVRIQAHWRGVRARKLLELRNASASLLQRNWRACVMRKKLRRIAVFGEAVLFTFPPVSLIQRQYRNYRLRKRWNGILEELDRKYLTSPLVRAEKETNKWYQPAMMLRRERLWRSAEVQKALQLAWDAVSAASKLRHSDRTGAPSLSWQQYYEISRKVYIVLMKRNDPREAFLLAKLDFERDTRNWPDKSTPVFERRVGRADFFRSWFELADVNTDSMDAGTYSGFVDQTAHTIVKLDPSTGAYMLRPDAEIYELVHAHTKAQKKVRDQLLAWHKRSAPSSRGHAHYEAPTVASVASRRIKHEAHEASSRLMVHGAAG